MSVTVKNRDKLLRKLALLPKASKEGVRESLKQSAREITNLMEALAPEATGRLKGSIGWTFGDPPKGSISIGRLQRGDLTVTIYAGDEDAFYARWIEFGTIKMPAHPFFFPAFRALRRRARSRMARSINKAMKQVANG